MHIKNNFSTYILVITSLLMLGSCATFPKAMPEDFSINYNYSAGMVANYKTIRLKTGECSVEAKEDGKTSDYKFKATREQMESLYQELLKARAFSLKSTTKKVYDRGGVSISYTFNSKTYEVSNSGMSFIVKGDLDNFTKCVNIISMFAFNNEP